MDLKKRIILLALTGSGLLCVVFPSLLILKQSLIYLDQSLRIIHCPCRLRLRFLQARLHLGPAPCLSLHRHRAQPGRDRRRPACNLHHRPGPATEGLDAVVSTVRPQHHWHAYLQKPQPEPGQKWQWQPSGRGAPQRRASGREGEQQRYSVAYEHRHIDGIG